MTSSRYSFSLLFVVVCLILSGCAGLITSRYPLPATRTQTVKEQFEGEWISQNDVICIEFDNEMVGSISSLDLVGHSKRLIMEMIVTSADNNGFISALLIENNKRQDEYYLTRYRFVEPDVLVFWNMNSEPFEDGISKGLLPVDAASRHMLTADPIQLLEFIRSNDSKELFDYRNPNVTRRIRNSCSFK